jgi:hypothetical protein
MDATLLAVILLAIWRTPLWGQRVLSFMRDLDAYRADRFTRRPGVTTHPRKEL